MIINTITKTYPHHYNTLTPLAKLITDYQVFIVRADSPYKTFGDLMAAVKKNPGAVKFAGGRIRDRWITWPSARWRSWPASIPRS